MNNDTGVIEEDRRNTSWVLLECIISSTHEHLIDLARKHISKQHLITYSQREVQDPVERHADASASELSEHKGFQLYQDRVEEDSVLSPVRTPEHINISIDLNYIVASVGGAVLELVAEVAKRRMLQALPEAVDDDT